MSERTEAYTAWLQEQAEVQRLERALQAAQRVEALAHAHYEKCKLGDRADRLRRELVKIEDRASRITMTNPEGTE